MKSGPNSPCPCGSGKPHARCCGAPGATGTLQETLQAALQHHQAGRLSQAETLYRQVLSQQPEHAEALQLLGMTAYQAGRHEQAVELIRRAIALQPAAPHFYCNLALALTALDQTDEAIHAYRQALQRKPEYAEAHARLGMIFHARGDLATARDHYRQALQCNPNQPAICFNLGAILQEEERLEEAETLYRQAIRLKPNYLMAHANLGYILKITGRREEAIQSYRQALQIDPASAEIHYNLGLVFQENEQINEAIAHFRKAIECKPEYIDAYYGLGRLLFQQQKYVEATTEYRKILAINPEHIDSYNMLGSILEEKRQFSHAIRQYEHVLELEADNIEAISGIGNALRNQKRYREAIEKFLHLLEIRPDHIPTITVLADTYEKTYQLPQAEEWVVKGLALDPGSPLLHITAAKLERHKGKIQEAIDHLKQILHNEMTPAMSSDAYYLLGQLHDRNGDTEQAYNSFMEANHHAREVFLHRKLDKNTYLNQIDKLSLQLTNRLAASWNPGETDYQSEQPLAFIVGFPRSGTTLLDKILDSHPGLQTLEEKPCVNRMEEEFFQLTRGAPDAMADLTKAQVRHLRNVYLGTVDRFLTARNSDCILVDKQALNASSANLIWRIFPTAKFILTIRHPCDVCLSCFMQNFDPNPAMANFLSLQDAVHVYAKVITMWRKCIELLPIDYHMIRYEDLINDLEGETYRLLEFLGVPWHDAILRHTEYAKNKGLIDTPSYHQVTKPLYSHARYRWKNYAKQLEPYMDILVPFIEYFGYAET